MNQPTIKHIKKNNHYVKWECGNCQYFRDLDREAILKLPDNIPVKSLGLKVRCQRCGLVGGSVQLSHAPSSNPFPGKVFYCKVPWKLSKLIEFEPGTASYKQQEAFLRHRNS